MHIYGGLMWIWNQTAEKKLINMGPTQVRLRLQKQLDEIHDLQGDLIL